MFIRKVFLTVVLLASLVGTPISAQAAPKSKTDPVGPVEVSSSVHSDVSQRLSDMAGSAPLTASDKEKKEKPLHLSPNQGNALKQPDGALQNFPGPRASATNISSFDGIGAPLTTSFITGTPPDTNGAVGATQYVQMVNGGIAVFDKTTGLMAAGFPKFTNALWTGFGGGCETNNDGDPIVRYDQINQRWIVTQFSISSTPYLECVAVSTTSDATGSYNRYSFSYGSGLNDYGKLGVWPDGYYISYNIFNNAQTFSGAKVCALDGAAMRAGTTALQQCFQLNTTVFGLLPSDLDGSNPPPAGAPNYFIMFDTNSLKMWKFHVDWANAANTTLTGPTTIPVPAFSMPCGISGTCIPQPGTTQKLDSLGDRLMYRLAYRNFGDHEALVVNHSVTAGASVGIRWYELRNPNTTPTLYQSGTFAPDANYRWMGSIAMDQSGDIALGYSISSASMFPSIGFTGRAPGDPAGTLQAETIITTGTGVETSFSRWGDYSAMTVDPVDDCTFWYTTEYYKTNGTFVWSTRIASFKFPLCGPQTLTSVTVSPASASVLTGATQQFTATALDQNSQPMFPQPAFTWSVSGGGTISASGLFTAGGTAGGPFTVTASSAGVNGTASVTVTLPSPVLTSITLSPASASVLTGATQQFTATGYDQFNQPMNPQPVFTWSVSGGGTIDASGLFTAGGTAGGPFTVTASSAGVNGTASVTVTLPPPVLTSVTLSPSSASVLTGATQQFTATGYDQFSQPLNPQPIFAWSVDGGGSIDAAGLFTAGGTAGGPFTVTASSAGVSGTASVTVTLPPPVLTTIKVSPLSASVATGATKQFTAAGLDQFNQPMNPQPAFTWTVSGGGTISASGLFTAGAVSGGPFTVRATSGAVSGTASVSVTGSALNLVTQITLAPATPNILKFGQNVTVGFKYNTNAAGGVRIFARPFSGTALTPNYAACGSPLYPLGSGTGSCTFTITSGAVTVDRVRFQIWNANQTILLFQTFIPVNYQFKTNSTSATLVSQLSFGPLTPNIVLFNQKVAIKFSYNTPLASGVRIFARPFSGSVATPNAGVCPSPIYPAGSGIGTCFFTVTSGANTVTSVRLQVWNANQTSLLFQAFVPVNYQFRGGSTTLSLTTLGPLTPNILRFKQNVTVGFKYATTAAGGVRIFARPMSGTALTPNYAACGSPLYPGGSGSGTCAFTITAGTTTVTGIRFQVWNANQTVLLFQGIEPVSFQFR